MRRSGKSLIYASAACFTLLLVGFVAFAASASRRSPAPSFTADGIVVLTGAERRIEAGLRLLRLGFANRLLISGVNPRTTAGDLLLRQHAAALAPGCCIDLGYAAQTTIGNASETKAWVERHRFRSLIVVTSSYHMPRSLNELALAMPDVELIAHPVVPRMLGDSAWWLNPSAARVLAAEYLKLLPSYARYAALRLLRPLETTAAPASGPDRARAAALWPLP